MRSSSRAGSMNNDIVKPSERTAPSDDALADLDSRRTVLTLPFRLSYWTIWRKKLEVDVFEYDFNWILQHAQGFDPQDIPVAVTAGSDGSLYRSLPVGKPPERVQHLDGRIVYVTETYQRYFADLRLGPEAYAKTFSSKSRSTLRRKVRKWGEACGGEVNWREYRTVDELGTFYSLARSVSERTYQENLLDAGLPADEVFQHQMIAKAERGEACGYILFDGSDCAVAYLYCPVHKGVVSYRYLGYLADHPLSGFSPGAILLWLALEKLQADPEFLWFDFTEGSDQDGTGQKARFSTGSVQCADVWVLRRRLAITMLIASHRFVDDFSEDAGRMLDRLGVKQRVKRWLRTRQS